MAGGAMMITRFAPSPTGLLHLGHAFSALTAFDLARARGGRFLLRIEDIDRPRCRPEFEQAIFEDLAWLGLDWPEPVMRQSARGAAYEAALARLAQMGLVYPCSCTRADIRAALSAPQEGAAGPGPDGPVYPGTCRGRSMETRRPGDAVRLDMARAMALAGPLTFDEDGPRHRGRHRRSPAQMVSEVGDVVLARKDIGTSYHIAVVVDDAAQQISHVVRGEDLFEATAIHVLLQRLLDLPTPVYHHHRLIRDANGKRLAKRDDARAIRAFRAEGLSPEDVRALVGL
ncbi:MAG: tRNA glutamyl-Q(34) synthetase GluQRS [Alphaproteobacteria bacterium]|nr:MAG: tRNA glutamyl-Q(34) synthetase GluQRS [Alphaproteobacteria bacterium]